MNYKILIYLSLSLLFFACDKEENEEQQHFCLPGKITFIHSDAVVVTTVEDADFWSYTRITNRLAEYSHPIWIRNSDKIVFISNYNHTSYPKTEGLYIVDSVGTEVTELVTLNENIITQCYSNVENSIVFATDQSIYTINIDGSGLDSIYSFSDDI